MGAIDRIIRTLKRQSDGRMMIAGSVKRPDLMRLEPDFGLIRYLPQVLSMLKGGDDAVLTRLVRFFEAQGLVVEGIATVAPELLAAPGVLFGTAAASPEMAPDVTLGFAVLDALAGFDVGQAIVVDRGRVLAIEGVEGTDRMLMRVAGLPGRTSRSGCSSRDPSVARICASTCRPSAPTPSPASKRPISQPSSRSPDAPCFWIESHGGSRARRRDRH